MDRFNGPPRIMIVTDLDHTMVDYNDIENISVLRFNGWWEQYFRHNSLLVYTTGRSITRYKQLRKEKPIISPDILITAAGAEISYGLEDPMVPDEEYPETLNHKWDRNIVMEEASKFSDLLPQPESEQKPHKVSFYIRTKKAKKQARLLPEKLKERGLVVKVLSSTGGLDLDIIPKCGGQGHAVSYLLKKLESAGKLPTNTLVCGDSGTDIELLSIPDVYGVLVCNSSDEILKWHDEYAKDNEKIIHATERAAAGIIQAIGRFELGQNTSPRDFTDIFEHPPETLDPIHEVIKFYLFWERWRRAEVHKTEKYMESLLTNCDSFAVSIHPSGTQIPLLKRFQELEGLHGDKVGKKFRLWVDKLFCTQIDPHHWELKFEKWEQCGTEMYCCATTAKIGAKIKIKINERIWDTTGTLFEDADIQDELDNPEEALETDIKAALLEGFGLKYEPKKDDEGLPKDPGHETTRVMSWMHVQQTWVEGAGMTDQSAWHI